MILLSRNAEHVFWLGRYLTRVQYLCASFPFVEDDSAMQYAKAFGLPVYNAQTLNELLLNHSSHASFAQQFGYIKNNIQDLRGVLDQKSFAELHQQIKNSHENFTLICAVVDACHDIFHAESEDVFLFYSLGALIEKLDHAQRLGFSHTDILSEMQWVINSLEHKGWSDINDVWRELKNDFNPHHFFQFNDQIQYLFEASV